MREDLTMKERKFCEKYVQCYNATQAYQEAYGVAYSTANGRAYVNLHNPKIISYIEELEHDFYREMGINAEHIAKALSEIAFSDCCKEQDRLKALDLLQKQLALQTQNVNTDLEINVNID